MNNPRRSNIAYQLRALFVIFKPDPDDTDSLQSALMLMGCKDNIVAIPDRTCPVQSQQACTASNKQTFSCHPASRFLDLLPHMQRQSGRKTLIATAGHNRLIIT
ncbi:MAG: hypothetical protein OEL20_00455 [Sulfuritalea sp.]|nr:hypothetical protein [Sulfuritalea sp.]